MEGVEMTPQEKAAEKWAISQCKKICDWDYVNCYHRANEKEGKHSCDEYTLQRTAFLAGVAWQHREEWKCLKCGSYRHGTATCPKAKKQGAKR